VQRSAEELLGAALATLPEEDPRRASALQALRDRLAKREGWIPDVDTYVRASRHPSPGVEPPLDASPFADLALRIGGEERRLLDTPGPIVVDVWATWCGPCKESLPHLDALARTYAGRVTVIAASVDDDDAKVDQYLAARGDPSFVRAWLGPDGMKRLGVIGIPTVFVFDGQHQLVARLSGYSPGSTALESAIEKTLRD
jgi:thioredoxin 1